jgi:hypothetical protein
MRVVPFSFKAIIQTSFIESDTLSGFILIITDVIVGKTEIQIPF